MEDRIALLEKESLKLQGCIGSDTKGIRLCADCPEIHFKMEVLRNNGNLVCIAPEKTICPKFYIV